jgi:glycerol-3-phosphate O-acyltransferase
MFVPVAINYDRVLEDRVLIAANERGDRKFGGKVSVVFKFVVHRTWKEVSVWDCCGNVWGTCFAKRLQDDA